MGSTPRGISGSRAAAILGLSEWSTPLQVWQEIHEDLEPGWNASRGYLLPEREENAAMRWGLAFEDAIVSLTEQKTGKAITDRERVFSDNFMTCHVDGMMDIEDEPVLFEGKSTNARSYYQKWGEPGTDRIPTSYACQVQHNMMLSGAEKCIVGVLVFPKMVDEWEEMGWLPKINPPDAPSWISYYLVNSETGKQERAQYWADCLAEMGFFHTYEIAVNPTVQKSMREVYADFWQRFILGDEEPQPGCYDDVRRLFPAPIGTIIASEQVERWITEYDEIGKETSKTGTLGKRREELKTIVLDWARKQDPVMDEASREKTLIMSTNGKKLAQWDGRIFR